MTKTTQIIIPDANRQIDGLLHQLYVGPAVYLPRSGPVADGEPVPAYTSSIDAAIELLEKELPGFSVGVMRKIEQTEVVVGQADDQGVILDLMQTRWAGLPELPVYEESSVSTTVAHELAASAICASMVMISASLATGRRLSRMGDIMGALKAHAEATDGIGRRGSEVNKDYAYQLFMESIEGEDRAY
jgi:hypothetical protein